VVRWYTGISARWRTVTRERESSSQRTYVRTAGTGKFSGRNLTTWVPFVSDREADMLEDIREDIQWAIDRLHDIKGDEKALAGIWAVIQRLEETLKFIEVETAGYDREAEVIQMEDIEEQISKKYRDNCNLT